MAMFKNCPIYYVKCDPKRPNAQYNKANPTWEVQLRTTDPAQKDEWIKGGLKAKLMVYKEGHEQEGEPIKDEFGNKQWRVNLKKKSIAKDGTKAAPVAIMTGGLEPMDPNTIGNGSLANVRVFQYTFSGKDGQPASANVLMAIQLKKHKVYTPKAHDDDFEEEDMETVEETEEGDAEQGDPTAPAPAAAAPKAPALNPVDQRPESAF